MELVSSVNGLITLVIMVVICRVETTCITVGGRLCVFPFLIEGVEYSECQGYGIVAWCSLTYDYDQDGEYDYCDDSCFKTTATTSTKSTTTLMPTQTTTRTTCITHAGNSDGRNCVFPFLYSGVERSQCQGSHLHAYAWCGTTYNYDTDGEWGYCDISCFKTAKTSLLPTTKLLSTTTRTTVSTPNPSTERHPTTTMLTPIPSTDRPLIPTLSTPTTSTERAPNTTTVSTQTASPERPPTTDPTTAVNISTTTGHTAEQQDIAVKLWAWIMTGALVLIITALVFMFSGYYYKKYRQRQTPVEGQHFQSTEKTDTHMRSSRVSNYSVYQEIGQNISAQIQAPQPPTRRPDQSIDTGIYMNQAEAGAHTGGMSDTMNEENKTEDGYLRPVATGQDREEEPKNGENSEILHTGVSDMINDENMTDGYLKPTNHFKPVATGQDREEEPENEFNDEYETYDHQDHQPQIPQVTTNGNNSPDDDNSPDYQAMKPHPPSKEPVEYQILKK